MSLRRKDIVETMMELGGDAYCETMATAAVGGYIDIVELIISKDANGDKYYNFVMGEAAANGHIEIIELMIGNGATNFDYAISKAVDAGQQAARDFLFPFRQKYGRF